MVKQTTVTNKIASNTFVTDLHQAAKLQVYFEIPEGFSSTLFSH